MHFDFSEDQRLLQSAVRDFLSAECTPEWIRERWAEDRGHCTQFWSKLSVLGVPGLMVPEADGGLGMDEIDALLLYEEFGRAALPEPVVATTAVGAPLLRDLGDAPLARQWLPKLASGEALLAVGHPVSPFVTEADVAALLLLVGDDGAIHALPPNRAQLTRQPGNDPSRRLFSVGWSPSSETRIAEGDTAGVLAAAALDRGALACAAQQLGVADRLIELAVDYASQRKQFGVFIGSFQAVKHMLADVKVKLEYARSLVYRAAHSVARDTRSRSSDVSMAKVSASEAALQAAKTALQVHGALGYTWEQDLHIWMRRAWSLDLAWGDGTFHRARLADAVVDGALPVESFGFEPSGVQALPTSGPVC